MYVVEPYWILPLSYLQLIASLRQQKIFVDRIQEEKSLKKILLSVLASLTEEGPNHLQL